MVEMNNIIPGKKSGQENENGSGKPFDKQQWATQKQQTRKSVYALIDSTAEAICKDNQAFRTFLDVQSRFDRYSIGNALLVTAQKPKATALKDFNGWKEAGTPVNKGESSFYILEPGEKFTREDGSVGVSMKAKSVFDISQTSAAPVKDERPKYDDRTLMKALISRVSVDIEPVDEMPEPQRHEIAYFDTITQTIYVKRNLDTPQLFRALAKELALADYAAESADYSRSEKNFKAVCVSYMLCKKFGIDTKEMPIRVPASYPNKVAQDIRVDLDEIRSGANAILARMSRTLEQYKSSRTNENERQDAR